MSASPALAPAPALPAPAGDRAGTLHEIERWWLRAGAVLLPLTYLDSTYDGYVLPKLLVARTLVLGLLVLFALRALSSRPLALKRSPIDLPLLAFVALAALSAAFAINPNVAVFGTYQRDDGLLTLITYAALFWLAVQALAGQGEARKLVRSLLVGGYLAAAAALIQSARDSAATGLIVPANGTFGNADVLGAYLAMLSPLAYHELRSARTWTARLLAANALLLMTTALLLTFSRSAWLGGALALAIVIGAGGRRERAWLAGAIALLAAGALLVSFTARGEHGLLAKVEARALSVFNPQSWGRQGIWRDSLSVAASRPLLGYGPDTLCLVFPRFQTGDWGLTPHGREQVDKAHAEVLQVAATQGVAGLAAYLWLLGAFLRAFWRGRRQEGAVALLAAWVGYQAPVQLNFTTLGPAFPYWLFAAAALELWGTTRPWASLRPGRLRAAAAVLAGLFGMGLAAPAIALPYVADTSLRVAVLADFSGRGDPQPDAWRARQLVPQESVYAVELGNIAFERSRWQAARAAYRDAAALGTFNPAVYRNLALADRELGLRDEARTAAVKAVELDRFDPANQALLAEFPP